MKRPSKCSLCSGVRLEAFELADSPIYAHGSCYVTNRVGIGARGLRPGPDAALLSVTGRSPVPRVSPTPPAIFRNTNHARIPEEPGPTPPTATGVTTSVGGSPVEFAGRRYRGQVALDRFGRRHVDSPQLKTWAVNGTSTRRAPAERPGGRWKTGVAATANGPGSLRTERAGRAGASRLRRRAPAIAGSADRRPTVAKGRKPGDHPGPTRRSRECGRRRMRVAPRKARPFVPGDERPLSILGRGARTAAPPRRR